MKVTLSNVAEETGFSISTVSRALRGIGKVSPNNKQLIIEAAKQLGYPLPNNSIARFERKHSLIALIVGFHDGEYFASLFNGFIQAGQEKNLTVSLFNAPPQVNEVCRLIKQLQNSGYSSAALMIPALHREEYQQILEESPTDFPIVSCSNIMHPILDTVTFDAYQGASLVADHFAKRGYKTVGFIEGPTEKPEARYRKNGFADTINHTSGIEMIWSFPGDYSIESGVQAFTCYEKLEHKPRAIFAADDATALGFMESARSYGYRFPEDIGLAGYDNLPICEYHFPTITSVDTDYIRLANATIGKLRERLFNPVTQQGMVSMVPVDLAIRNSS